MGLMISSGTQFIKVWGNPQPANSFTAQTVNVDLSIYDAIMIICTLRAGYAQRKTEIIKIGGIGNVQIFSFGDRLPGAVRQVTANQTSIVFTDGIYYNYDTSQYVVDNMAAVPILVYGIRF